MIAIKPDCTAQARNMVETQATYLGGFATLTFYVLDGKAWAITGETVLRSDDDHETTLIIRTCKSLQLYRDALPSLQEIANDPRTNLVKSERRNAIYSILNDAGLL